VGARPMAGGAAAQSLKSERYFILARAAGRKRRLIDGEWQRISTAG